MNNYKFLHLLGELIGLIFLPGTGIVVGGLLLSEKLFNRPKSIKTITYMAMVAGCSLLFWSGTVWGMIHFLER